MKINIIKMLLALFIILSPLIKPFTVVYSQQQSTTSAIAVGQSPFSVDTPEQNKINAIEKQVDFLTQNNSLVWKVDTLINLISLFATILLGVFALIGGLLVWNAYRMKQEAKENLDEIKRIRSQSTDVFEKALEAFRELKKVSDETVKNADSTVILLTEMAKNATEQSKEIEGKYKKLDTTLAEWDQRRKQYQNVSQGTVGIISSLIPPTKFSLDEINNMQGKITSNYLDIDGNVKSTLVDAYTCNTIKSEEDNNKNIG